MLKSLWTLIKLALFLAVVIWVAQRPGTVSVSWEPYVFTLHIGLFLALLLSIVVVGAGILQVVHYMTNLPKTLDRYRDMTGKDKGIKAVTLGLAAVAAGDAKNASYQAHRAERYLKGHTALPQLLKAQAARLSGNTVEAGAAFSTLLEDKNARIIGLRGLLQSALESEDYEGAREVGYKALAEYPHQAWLIKIVYDLEITRRNWDGARTMLYRAEKSGALHEDKAKSDRVAIYLAEAGVAKAEGDEKTYFRAILKAYKSNPHFIPCVVMLAELYLARGKRKAAASIIEKMWKTQAHPDLAVLWRKACPAFKQVNENVDKPATPDDPVALVRWMEKLVTWQPDSVCALLALARLLMDIGLWGQARNALEKAEDLRTTSDVYKLFARLEERAHGDQIDVLHYMEKAANAPQDKVWICAETGRVYDAWSPISDQGLFNTIIWDLPQGRMHVPSQYIGSGARHHPALLVAS